MIAEREYAVADRHSLLGPLICCWCLLPAHADAQSRTAPASPSTVQWSVTNTTRIESWSFFEPPPAGGDPDYAFFANRLRLGATGTWSRLDYGGSVQYVQFAGLPDRATGPGPLGTGALYYVHSGRTDSRGVYIRTLFGRVRLPGGTTVQAGRFPYQSGAESPSGQPKIESVKRARVDARLIGEFEWSLYQRTFDGVRVDLDRGTWHLSTSWLTPTQGGFEEHAGARLGGIDLGTASLALRPSAAIPATDLNVFIIGYHDDRPVSARPDNTGLTAERVEVSIATLGAAAVGSAPVGHGEADWLVWLAGQAGSWYSQDHRAWSVALEGGYQWKTRWQPWVRAGFLHASGDDDPADDRHGTFFPMLPTVRKYALTTAYAPMNLDDVFVEVAIRPMSRLSARLDMRRVWLASAQDLWFSGSGPTQQRGSIFGYAGRRSGGFTDFGTVTQGAADVSLGGHWSVNSFIGLVHAGPVVGATFTGRWLRFFYVENVVAL